MFRNNANKQWDVTYYKSNKVFRTCGILLKGTTEQNKGQEGGFLGPLKVISATKLFFVIKQRLMCN